MVNGAQAPDDALGTEMILARFHTEALTRVRFAISPMFEMIRSIRTLHDPAGAALHLPWVEQAAPLIADLDLSALVALQSSPVYNPDFVNPPPRSAMPTPTPPCRRCSSRSSSDRARRSKVWRS
jgi:hypothetical protein